jgi:hypothetical protein
MEFKADTSGNIWSKPDTIHSGVIAIAVGFNYEDKIRNAKLIAKSLNFYKTAQDRGKKK